MARKSEILPSDSISRRSTLQVLRPSTISSTSSSISTSVSSSSNASIVDVQSLRDQNRILAQRNTIYSGKLTELENKLETSQLEITRLKNLVSKLITSIESKITDEFQDVLQFIQNLRDENGLTKLNNEQNSLPTSSSSSSGDAFSINKRGIITTPSPAFNIERDVENSKSYLSIEVPQYFKRKKDNESLKGTESKASERSSNFPIILEILESDSNEENDKNLPLSKEKTESIVTETELIPYKVSIGNYTSLITNTSKEELSQDEKESQKSKQPKSSRRKTMIPTTSSSVESKYTSESENIQIIEPNVRSPTPEIKKEPMVSPSRRPTRARKEVSYKPVSLNAKMRRESAKLLDAVGENVLINYAVNKSKSESTANNNNEPKPNKRKPLKNITNTNNSTKKRKSMVNIASSSNFNTDADLDLSVFDFDHADTKPKKKRNRRYTTIG